MSISIPLTDLESSLILSIQSHVAYGYVGNRAAVLPLNALGHEVITLNTVQLSNHTGYGDFEGDFFAEDHLHRVLTGIKNRGVFPDIKAVLTGYLGNPSLGGLVLETVKDIKAQADHDVLYICDPVMGDVGRGFFVKEGLPAFFKNEAMGAADIMTPNQFELEYLSGQTIETRDDARVACRILHGKGVKHVLLTSLEVQDTPADSIQMLLSSVDAAGAEQSYVVTTPKLFFETPLNGSGDATAALFSGYIMRGLTPCAALEHTAASIYTVFERTQEMGRRELSLVQSQAAFDHPVHEFTAQPL